MLATASGNTMSVWDILSGGRVLQTVCAHSKTITSLCADASVFDVFFDIFAVAFLPAACGLGFSYILQARARRLCVLARVCV